MTDLPSNQAYIQAEETDTESPISEQTMQKMGSAINFLNDLFQQQVTFTSSGVFNVPEGVTRLYVMGAGGGGGAGNRAGASGAGGSGALPISLILTVTPLDSFTVTIGAGGAGGGIGDTVGGTGGITSLVGSSSALYFPGAAGGNVQTPVNTTPGYGGAGSVSGGGPNTAGDNSYFASGGASGGSGFGGGGGAGYGVGGAGKFQTAGNGESAAANTSAGGGASGNGSVYTGGAGGSGILIIGY